ncbi:MAG: aspartate-semialdehyde dehydrogenase [Parachlamydia sp.]|nr:aspartate-semialdehyde dehydrogenase [Parachlamydia sp.]
MSSDFFYRDKIPVAILGATGCVGQKMVQLLENHPWFKIAALCASDQSAGKAYREAVHWLLPTPIPSSVADFVVQPCRTTIEAKIVFSALESNAAFQIEKEFAEAGYLVVSNASAYRMEPDVPLLVAEVNPGSIEAAKGQKTKGKIFTNPNCSVSGVVLALKPLWDRFGLKTVHIVTMQALSGSGYPGVASLDIADNLIPYIPLEEEKLETEPLKILGTDSITISATCNRVPITDGHTACVSIKLSDKPSMEMILEAWKQFKGEPQELQLPSAPFHPLHYFNGPFYPQPKLHRLIDKEMAVCIGRLRPCPVLDYKFTLLSHNTVRGAAGAALLNAELLVRKGWVYW